MSITATEIATQPATWKRAIEMLPSLDPDFFPAPGQSVAMIGCGTSWFMAQAYCRAREVAGLGVSDAFTATEFPLDRKYDLVITLSRSGTTTEIIDILKALHGKTPTRLITAVGNGPATPHTDKEVVLDFADEQSVVQTRFATTALVLLRASLGENLDAAIRDCEMATTADIPEAFITADQFTFLGTAWTYGLANEAALKMREASQSWTEAYPAMEYRHGPISIAQPGRVTWIFGPVPTGMEAQIAETGATLVHHDWDPLASLVLLQRVAVARAKHRGLNPDTPRHLTRSVILS